ncbi:unnamed protein product [Caenorhabditis auriculariae]|uniref:Uncharacterized protein n=1 Tax=Caenorhabditis auriculariae TaxID=2777116 RepID=A0A8S1HH22_9PELO|nr:unnamed protein product [Caenorhabditis auriculariae]
MLSALRALIIAQISGALLLCLLIPISGLYCVLPIPILFSMHQGFFPFPQMTYYVYITLNYTLMFAVALCTRTAVRNALTACHVQFFEWTHETCLNTVETIYAGSFLFLFALTGYPAIRVVEWDQDSMWAAAFRTDPRIKEFAAEYRPFFVCYKKWVIVIFGLVSVTSVCVVFGFLFLAHM